MVVVAGLLVLAGLALFVTGILTDVTAWYWACVGVCGIAAVLLVIARLRTTDHDRTPVPSDLPREHGPTTTGPTTGATRAGVTEAGPTGWQDAAPPAGVPEATAPGAEPPARSRHGRHEAPDEDGPTAAPPVRGPGTAPSPAAAAAPVPAHDPAADPAEEDVEVTDLLLVVDLADEVLVVDEHPRYHLADCRWLAGRATVRLPVGEARSDGFTPCAVCGPDRHLAAVERARRAARRG
ncbi:hypothetical protein [Geodermatophilus sp. URMC 62]|uniref:hypothetical protein n=1 Tax=Geodermatophilus sp. URMC 62 TaxID=3423414 RepID=UPI00406C778A